MQESPEINILLIEDNPGDARLIRDMLDEGYHNRFSFFHVKTLSEAGDKLSACPFDAVLLDIGLPDSTGVDSITKIKHIYPETPVIMLTGLDDEETAIASLKMGAQDYLVKGQIETALLLRSIRYAIERNHSSLIIASNQRFIQNIADTTPDILYIFDLIDHRLVYVNKALEHMLGYSPDDINRYGKSLYSQLAHPDDLEQVHDYLGKLSLTNEDISFALECRVKHRDGQWLWIRFRSVVFSRVPDGSAKEILGTAHDITDRKEAENHIKMALEEKDILLREIHHRVKNNMTVIVSMLKLQSRHVKDEQNRQMFNDSISRIKSMALVHEKLYRSDNLRAIKFSTYLKDLTTGLFITYKIPTDRIRLIMDVEDVIIGIDTAVPCGLIINELVSNSMKHAFPDPRTGEIKVLLHEIEESINSKSAFRNPHSEIELVVSDNGAGISGDIYHGIPRSLGLTLVNALVKQLRGTIEVSAAKGTEFRIRFKK